MWPVAGFKDAGEEFFGTGSSSPPPPPPPPSPPPPTPAPPPRPGANHETDHHQRLHASSAGDATVRLRRHRSRRLLRSNGRCSHNFPADFRDGGKNPTPQQLEQPDVQFEPAVKRLSNCFLGIFLLLGICLQGPENHPHCPVSEQNILF